MIRPWRTWVLLILLVGPFLVYMGFGALWLYQLHRGWIIPIGVAWVLSGLMFSVLLTRWTNDKTELLPPLDWDAPQTFAPHDRKAWELVQQEAELGENLEMTQLSEFDIYTDTGKRLARRLAAHYQPLATDPIEHVPVVELLTALELASEDLNQLCRQVPGGDLITASHWKKAVKAANLVSRANDIYSVILPLFNPLTGLVRLGTRQMIQKPAWRDMQQNLLRWFYRAFVNRLGVHLIELYSGRLVIGSDQYRKIIRRGVLDRPRTAEEWDTNVTIGVAGRRGIGKAALIAAIELARKGEALASAIGVAPAAIDRIKITKIVEIPGYTLFETEADEGFRDRSSRAEAIETAVQTDLLMLLIPSIPSAADLAFARAWNHWLIDHPNRESAPILIVAIDTDDADPKWLANLEPLRSAFTPNETLVVAIEQGAQGNDLLKDVLPPLIGLLPRGERTALIRHLQKASSRSKAKRLFGQVTQQGAKLWKSVARGPGKSKV